MSYPHTHCDRCGRDCALRCGASGPCLDKKGCHRPGEVHRQGRMTCCRFDWLGALAVGVSNLIPQVAQPVHDLLAASEDSLERLLGVLARSKAQALGSKLVELRQVGIVSIWNALPLQYSLAHSLQQSAGSCDRAVGI